MAVSLTTYMNSKLKAMGKTSSQAKKNAGKYKSIAAAKKAGSLYYTDKNGKVMAAVYAEDLKKPISSAPKKSIKPKARPKKKAGPPQGPTRYRGTLDEKIEVDKANAKPMTKAQINAMAEAALDRKPMAFKSAAEKKAAAKKHLKNKNVDASITFGQFKKMTAEEKKAAGLPVSMGQTEKSFNRFMATRKKKK